jgi:hypothetical protein
MKGPFTLTMLIAVSSAVLDPLAAHPECLRFSPAESELSGTLDARTYPGPPTYESIADGNRAERAFILTLAKSLCVDADPKSEINSAAQAGIREVHIRWSGGGLTALVGRHVIVRGQLETATIAHDRTAVAMDVTAAREQADKPLQPTRPTSPPG